MRIRLLFVALAILTGCESNPATPSAPANEPVVVIPVTCAGNEAVKAKLVLAPPSGSPLRLNQSYQFGVEFSLPVTAYPTWVDLRAIFPNPKGGVTAASCTTMRLTTWSPVDNLYCSLPIDGIFADPQWGVAGPVNLEFHVFNFPGYEHTCDLNFYKTFPTGFVYQP